MAAKIIQVPPVLVASSISYDPKRRIHPQLILQNTDTNTRLLLLRTETQKRNFDIVSCLPPPPPSNNRLSPTSTKLFVSGLSFRTTEESLRNAFKTFGQLLEVNLVMDKLANRPKGYAFVRYATEEESQKAIEGMHGKFLYGRVIFVEFAKPRSDLQQGIKQKSKLN
ncbi:hypothetical protein ACH5RR_008729 [Cinchona calisaya]|uniref:RRM domain-containing protein n=1 Tax=Cinchona calisaya TaxID=153742 RepID=A0ABD3ACG5_9GENT